MRKRYNEQELTFIEQQAKLGTNCELIGQSLGVSAVSIQHVLSRRGIAFCRKPFDHLPEETWTNCPGNPDIQVSTMGRFARISTNSLISGYQTTGGYVTVDFSGRGTFSAHRLVAETFIPNPENKPEVNHRDGIKTNNGVSNLEWVTPQENIQHAIVTGLKTFKSGQDHHRTALTLEQIVSCEGMHSDGKTYEEIGEHYNVGRKTVSRHVSLYRRDTERSETIL
jgi:hypothetical protein